MVDRLFLTLPLTLVSLAAAEPLTVQEAIRTAWAKQAGLQAGQEA